MTTIYLLTDPRTAEVRYVGQTAKSMSQRLANHCSFARRGIKTYCAHWLRSLLAEGLLPYCIAVEQTEAPDERERYWIAHYRAAGCRLTNITAGGGGGAQPPEILAVIGPKVSAALRGRPKTPEHAAKVAAALRGQKRPHHSEEHKARIGAAHLGKKWPDRKKPTPETIARRAASNTGKKKRPHTEEAKRKMSLAKMGQPSPRKGCTLSDETKAKLRAANLGKKHGPMSPELKRKIGDAISAAKQAKKREAHLSPRSG